VQHVALACRPPDTAETGDGGGEHGVEADPARRPGGLAAGQVVASRSPPDAMTRGGASAVQRPQASPGRQRLLHELRWKLLVARLAVSIVAVVLTVVIVPGITIDDRFWVWSVVLGAVFGVLNGVVKPILQVLTLRYLFRSYGLVLILVNTATLWLLELLVSPLDIDTGFSLVVGGVVIGLLMTVLEALVGIIPPVVDPQTRSSSAAAG
jgi:putative membrane protein